MFDESSYDRIDTCNFMYCKKLESISDCLVCAGTNCAMNHNEFLDAAWPWPKVTQWNLRSYYLIQSYQYLFFSHYNEEAC